MATTSLVQLVANALPALSGASVTYNPEKNVFLTLGYTSRAGNTYFKAVRFSDRLAVHYDIGKGYAHTFLNGITLFAWDGSKAVVIGRKEWGGCGNWIRFSEHFAEEQTIKMLGNYLQSQARLAGRIISESHLLKFSRELVLEMHTNCKQIA